MLFFSVSQIGILKAAASALGKAINHEEPFLEGSDTGDYEEFSARLRYPGPYMKSGCGLMVQLPVATSIVLVLGARPYYKDYRNYLDNFVNILAYRVGIFKTKVSL